MKKYFLILLLVLFCLTGCTIINKKTPDDVVSLSLNEVVKTNTAFKGFKLYVPTNMNVMNDTSENVVLTTNGDKYYLYVDLISYYNKVSNDYKINEEQEAFYSKILNDDGKSGYVLITKYDNKYFVEVMYNYAKIEVITNNYKEALSKSLIILNNLEFNDKIIDSLVGKNILEYDEEKFNLLGPSGETTNFLEWVSYDEEEENKSGILDEDIIDIESE